ncbi:MAG: hypothetical protein Q8922_13990 [Bacteroidota bacterium]|nr:hypothetical protein [Bacteroidota bacterium]MDP4232827.1 hypothetical protein [Bacteroidota bacterium]MDP4242492.1 hypothetical protein [Bacteroidota bacterium]MDP4289030.1 hypothetical protein [Bacteroidota bacterium]
MNECYDLLIGWTWEYDRDFVLALERHAQAKRRLSTFQVHEGNIEEVLARHRQRKLEFGLYLDRAFDVDERFERLGRSIERRGGAVVNSYDHTVEAIDKATMHLEFIEAGLHVPFTIIISPYKERQEVGLTPHDLAHLGRPFIIKPANTTGGGIGVVTGAESLLDVIEARKELQADKYLLQERIIPRIIGDRRCWFRCFYVFDKILLTWWDDQTHRYALVTPHEEHYYTLRPLRRIMRTIGQVSGLNFFSSEIALRQPTPYERSQFVVVDYVNDMCDMRATCDAISGFPDDGIPNVLRERIVDRLSLAASKRKCLSDWR